MDIDATDVGKLILRLVLGPLVLLHGIAKFTGGFAFIVSLMNQYGLPEFFAYAVYLGEVLGPLMIIIGVFTRVGAGLIAINMLVAIVLVHLPQLLELGDHGGWALELQGMYLFTALALTLLGSGRLAVHPD